MAGGQGPQPWRILLLLRAQCVLYGRYGSELAPYKYAGYGLLLDTIRDGTARGTTAAGAGAGGAAAPPEAAAAGSFLSGEVLEQVAAAAQLCWLTVLASPRNCEELCRNGGVQVLAELLSR